MRTVASTSICSNETTRRFLTNSTPIRSWTLRSGIASLATKADTLFSLSVYYVVLFQEAQTAQKVGSTLAGFSKNPKAAARALHAHFSGKKKDLVLGQAINDAQAVLVQKTQSFILQVSDFLSVRILNKQEAFRVLKKTLNFHPDKLDLARPKHNTF